jgi:Arc/MetJ-type ribon-helix-helix transcriptional regulator
MAKAIVVKPKRGRPSTGGRDPFVGIRLPEGLLDEIDVWSSKNEAASRSEAIRRLIEIGLKVKTPARPVSKPGQRARALELAAKTIKQIVDPSAPSEERAQRRRRLTKGPTEFCDDRVDLPKVKDK